MAGDGVEGSPTMGQARMPEASKRRRRSRLGPAFRLAVAILRPFLTTFTRRHWVGEENLRGDSGIVLAANHLSWFDPLVISHILWLNDRPPRFLAKDSLFTVPFIGWVLRDTGQIPVVRGTRDAALAVEAAVDAARSGECVVVYPEGTITKDPDMWPARAKTGAARIALSSGAPLIPMAHWGAQEIMGPYRKELKLLPRKSIHVAVGPPVDLDDLRGREMTTEVLQIASTRLMAAITQLLIELRQMTPSSETDRESA
jgi:1-acyl-sn-glycerol-3-phosphate acyltransferase